MNGNKFKLSTMSLAISLALTGCVGGGGGGGGASTSATLSSFVRSSVPYHTPVRAGTHDTLQGTSGYHAVTDIFARDLNNDSIDEVVFAGRKTQPSTIANWTNYNLQIYGWNNTGTFKNETSSWFSGTDNVILGTEPAVRFGDFNNDGKVDMFVAPGTDMQHYGPGVVYLNNGNNFTRRDLNFGNAWTHDATVADLNGDGIADIITMGYSNPSIAFGAANGTFNVVTGPSTFTGSGISVADYLSNGSKTIVVTDTAATGNQDTKLFSWSVASGNLVLTPVSTLPASRFYLPKWDSTRASTTVAPHEIRNIAFDFNRDGRTDVIVFSVLQNGTTNVNNSEVQFLRNDGSGNFTDVTDSVLRNYNTTRYNSYQPVLVDVNNDGLLDIFLSATTYNDAANSSTVLVATQEGVFTEQYTSVFTDFAKQIKNIQGGSSNGYQTMNIVTGPNNIKYLVSSVQYVESGVTKTAVYLAKIGSFGTTTAQASINTIQNVWPWMSASEANTVLANTAVTNFAGYDPALHGNGIIDMQAILNPIGWLGISLDGRTGARQPIVGGISVPGLRSDLLSKVSAVDSLGRDFTVNLAQMNVEPMAMPMQIAQVKDISESWSSKFVSDNVQKANNLFAIGSEDSTRWTAGGSMKIGAWTSRTQLNMSATQMPGSPWMAFNGVFGEIKNSTMVEASVTHSWENGAWLQGGGIQTTTNIKPGMVREVGTLYSAYAVGGYRQDGWNFYGGVQPTIVAGDLTLRLPSAVDINGVMSYTDHKVDIRQRPVSFIGVSKNWKEKAHTWGFNLTANDQKQYNAQFTYKVTF